MSDTKINMQICQSLIKELFDLVKLPVPENITDNEIKNLIIKLKSIINKEYINLSSEQYTDEELKSILVVDDLGLVVYQLSLLLTKNNYNVSLARSEPEAYNVFNERGPFNYVIMDLFMPDKQNGINLLKNLKSQILKNNLSTKIFIMSVSKDEDTINELFRLGADNFIEKSQDWKTNLINMLNNLQAV